MPEPRISVSPLPEVHYSGRYVRADDWWRDVVLTLGMLLFWLAGFALWIACWRYGRSIGGSEGHLIRFVSFCICGFHVVSLGIIRTWFDRVLSRLGW
jgi:hypothetical protein